MTSAPPAPRRRRRKPSPPPPPPLVWQDPLFIASVGAIIVIGMVVIADLLNDGKVDPSILALLVSVIGPLTPALILRNRK